MHEDMEAEMEREIERRIAMRLEEKRQLRLQRGKNSDEESNDFSGAGGTVPDRVNPGNCRWQAENYNNPYNRRVAWAIVNFKAGGFKTLPCLVQRGVLLCLWHLN